jgi:hypothetical protein
LAAAAQATALMERVGKMNLRIPLPRMPARVTALLDRYSDWAEQPAGPRLGRYQVLRRDWVSVGIVVTVSAVYATMTASWVGFALGVGAGIASWIWFEASLWSPREKL